MAIFPFTEDVDSLIDTMDTIPIDPEVPCAERFQAILLEHSGNPWGPNATARSKLATRLHFAGWSRQELEHAGLKPKDVENFRRKFDLKVSQRAHRRTRPATLPHARKGNLLPADPTEAIRVSIQQTQAKIAALEASIEAAQQQIEKHRQELSQHEAALKVYQS